MDPRILEQLNGPTPKAKATFYDHAAKDGKASAEKGRPVHKRELYIQITPTGSGLQVRDSISRKARPTDRQEYAEEYQRYLVMKEQDTGRPLALLPSMTVEAQADLNALGVFTIEQLAALDKRACAEFLLKAQNAQEAEPEVQAELVAAAHRAVNELDHDFAQEIREAKHYAASGAEQFAAAPMDENRNRREAGGSVPVGPEHHCHAPAQAERIQSRGIDLAVCNWSFQA